jgi:hypothetical protein
MVTLTDSQARFLRSQQIPESAIFDASGMSRRRYQYEMEIEEKLFAIGVAPCKKGKHTIRTRNGHCIQCNTANIAFVNRHYQDAYVYIAGSRKERVIKIGCSATPWNREALLNQRGYGGISDWCLLFYARFPNAGKIEFFAHHRLSKFASYRTYFRESIQVECREIFSCGYSEARDALTAASANGATKEWQYSDGRTLYQFGQPSRESMPLSPETFNPVFLRKVDELELSVRSSNCLKNENITYLGDLVRYSESEMLRIPNFGRKGLNEIRELLAQMGLQFGIEVPGWPPEDIESFTGDLHN